MDQRSRVEQRDRLESREAPVGENVEFAVGQGNDSVHRAPISGADRRKQACQFSHSEILRA